MHEAGYQVLLIGRLRKNSRDLKRPYPIRRMNLIFERGFAFYAEYNLRLFFLLLTRGKDLLYANDLDTLLPNFLVSRISNIPLVYDSHEYFTEVPEMMERHAVRSVWLSLEKMIFPRLKNVITVNRELAEIYLQKYGVKSTVIRNVPELSNYNPGSRKLRVSNKPVLIYQGSLNTGRGIELMIDCMALACLVGERVHNNNPFLDLGKSIWRKEVMRGRQEVRSRQEGHPAPPTFSDRLGQRAESVSSQPAQEGGSKQ